MDSSRAVLTHLLTFCDALYRELGQSAGTFTSDALVIRAHDMSRAFGDATLALRSVVGDVAAPPYDVISTVLSRAVSDDDSGALVLYAVAVVVGVSNADAQTGGGKGCSACSVAGVGGGVLGLAGMVVSTVGIVRGISNMSSEAALSVEPPASAPPPTGAARQEGVWRRPEVLAGAWGRPVNVSVLDLRF